MLLLRIFHVILFCYIKKKYILKKKSTKKKIYIYIYVNIFIETNHIINIFLFFFTSFSKSSSLFHYLLNIYFNKLKSERENKVYFRYIIVFVLTNFKKKKNPPIEKSEN